jgi:hypothetical protein
MSTAMTDTFPNLEYSSDPASGTLYGVTTMPFGALAWSAAEPEEAVVQPEPAPVAAAAKPRISRVMIVSMLFGGVTVVAAVGAIMLGGNDSASTPLAIADHTQSAPYVAPAPLPTADHVAVPAPAPVVISAAVPAVAPPKAVTPTQPTAAPPATETPKPTLQRQHWYWLRRILQQQDHQQDGQGQKR